MAKVLSLLKIIRNNWKKSALGTGALTYGISYGKQTYDLEHFMRQCCEDVVKYGDAPCSTNSRPRHVTIILNPVAKRRKAKKLLEKYCEPLLHLAGISTTIIHTQSKSDARNIINNLTTPTDAIIVAGGDGTLSDTITGLMRKYECNLHSIRQCPIGILPLGNTNTVASIFYEEYQHLADIHHIVDATMAIIQNNCKLIDAIEIKLLENDPENPIKPVYAIGNIRWGAWSDVHAHIDKYWYLGFLRKYAAYIFKGYKSDLSWKCNAVFRYTNPCKGCSHCYKELFYNQSEHTDRRWWHAFLPKKRISVFGKKTCGIINNHIDYTKVINEDCGIFYDMAISTTELSIKTENADNIPVQSIPSLKATFGPENINYITFVKKGWKLENKNELSTDSMLDAKNIELYPEIINKDQVFYIDNEEYELKPIQIKLLSQSIKIFCPVSSS